MFKFCWEYSKSLMSFFLIYILIGIITVGLSLYLIYFGGQLVDFLICSPNLYKIKEFIIFYCILNLILLGFIFLIKRIEKVIQLKMTYSITNEALNHISKVSLFITNKTDPIALNQRINFDVQTIINFYLGSISQIITNAITILITIFIFYKINLYIFFIVICLLFLYLFFYELTKQRISNIKLQVKNNYNFVYTTFQNRLSFLRTIKIFNLENNFTKESDEAYQNYYSVAMNEQKYSFSFQCIETIITMIAQVALYLIGGLAIINDELTIGIFTILTNYLNKNISAIKYFISLSQQFLSAKTSYIRINELLQYEAEREGQETIEVLNDILINNLSFGYNSNLILDNFNAKLKKGKSYCINGDNGQGKSTLMDLICGLYKGYYLGEILINGIELNKLNMKLFREKIIGYVEQKPIVTKTIIESSANNSDTELRENILKRFHFELSLLKSNIKNDYARVLSGGEIQKVCIANEFSKKKQILILDEPTSMLDKKSKETLFDLIAENKKKCLIIIISHDKDVYKNVDEIITL